MSDPYDVSSLVQLGKGSSARVFLLPKVPRQPRTVFKQSVITDPTYRITDTEQLLAAKAACDAAGISLPVWVDRNAEQFMRWQGSPLPSTAFFSPEDLVALGRYVAETSEALQRAGVAMPDWKPDNVCTSTVVTIMFEGVFAGNDDDTAVLDAAIDAAEQLCDSATGLFSIEHIRTSFTNDLQVLIRFQERADAHAAVLAAMNRSIRVRGVEPTVESGQQFSMIDFNALYVMADARDALTLFPARGTFCPYGADYQCVYDDAATMAYGMWFAAAILMGWARTRCSDLDLAMTATELDELMPPGAEKFHLLPTTAAEFRRQHNLVASLNAFPGGIALPDPEPVIAHLVRCYVLRNNRN